MRGPLSELTFEPEPTASARPKQARRVWLFWGLLFSAAFVLYAISASSEVHWQDAGQYELRVAKLQLIDPDGLCRSHPLHFWLCAAAVKAIAVPLPLALSFVSALAGALAVANVFGIVRQWTGQTTAGVVAAGGLALSESFWQFSSIPGAHVISAAILTLEFWALLNWVQTRRVRWLILMFLANGISLANHNMALLSLPVIGAVLVIAIARGEARWGTAVWSIVAWLAGSSMYLWLILAKARSDGLGSALQSAMVGIYGNAVAGRHLLLTYTATSIAFTLLSFPNLMLPAAIVGILRWPRVGSGQIAYWALLAATALQLGFVLRYNVITQYTFLLPAYALIAIFSGLGFAAVLRIWSPVTRRAALALGTITVLLTPAIYVAAYGVTRHFHLLGGWARNKPYRDDYRYLLIPWSRGEHSAQRMSVHASELAGIDGLIIQPDGMGGFAVEYQLLLQGKSKVQTAAYFDRARVESYVRAGKPVVLVPVKIGEVTSPPTGVWKSSGDLYYLDVGRSPSPSHENGK
jgi:hypothetical protein